MATVRRVTRPVVFEVVVLEHRQRHALKRGLCSERSSAVQCSRLCRLGPPLQFRLDATHAMAADGNAPRLSGVNSSFPRTHATSAPPEPSRHRVAVRPWETTILARPSSDPESRRTLRQPAARSMAATPTARSQCTERGHGRLHARACGDASPRCGAAAGERTRVFGMSGDETGGRPRRPRFQVSHGCGPCVGAGLLRLPPSPAQGALGSYRPERARRGRPRMRAVSCSGTPKTGARCPRRSLNPVHVRMHASGCWQHRPRSTAPPSGESAAATLRPQRGRKVRRDSVSEDGFAKIVISHGRHPHRRGRRASPTARGCRVLPCCDLRVHGLIRSMRPYLP